MIARNAVILNVLVHVFGLSSLVLSGCALSVEKESESCEGGKASAIDGNYEKALSQWATLARGNTAKERLRAVMECLTTTGITSDASSSAKWMMDAANSDIPDAQMYMGMLYASGAGVTQDIGKAQDWLSTAAGNGSKSAADLLELLSKQ